MKTNKDTIQSAMDRRLSFLDDVPSCRAALKVRIAQEEEPVMKRKVSVGFVFAMILVLLTAAGVAAGLLLSPKVSASRTADKALEKVYGVTEEMQTYFTREEDEQEDGSVVVTYTGAGSLEYVLGTYTAVVKDGRAEITWSYDGMDTSGGYESEYWGREQLARMMAESFDEQQKITVLRKAYEIGESHGFFSGETEAASDTDAHYGERRETEKTAAMKARKLDEEAMIETGREFIIGSYELDDEQVARMELYTNSFTDGDNTWYEMVNGKPCFQVEYLLYCEYTTEQLANNEPRARTEKDGYYIVYVNVETGEIEEYVYNSALGGIG